MWVGMPEVGLPASFISLSESIFPCFEDFDIKVKCNNIRYDTLDEL